MTRQRTTRLAAALLVTIVPATLAACGDDDDATTSSSSAEMIGPIVVDVASLGGTTVEVAVGRTIDVDVGDTDVTAWTATIADDAVLRFVAGRDDGSATFNPGFDTVASGTTAVTLDGPDGPIDFTVDVVAS